VADLDVESNVVADALLPFFLATRGCCLLSSSGFDDTLLESSMTLLESSASSSLLSALASFALDGMSDNNNFMYDEHVIFCCQMSQYVLVADSDGNLRLTFFFYD
jgi:hypothetical protein